MLNTTPVQPRLDPKHLRFLARQSEMCALVREFDWSSSALGAISTWSPELRTAIGIVMNATQPMFLWWGPDLIQVYNDGYLPFFGQGKHPCALGQRGKECWPEIWDIIGPQIVGVLHGVATPLFEDRLVPILRNARIEDVYWTYSYSPVYGADDSVAGVLVVCTETTAKVLAERRRLTIDTLQRNLQSCDSLSEIFAEAQRIASAHPEDIAALKLTTGSFDSPMPSDVVCISSADLALQTELALAFRPSSRLPLDADYRQFFEQFFLIVHDAKVRFESDRALHLASGERDRLLLDAPVGTAVMVGKELRYALANSKYCEIIGRFSEHVVDKPFAEIFPELVGTHVHQTFLDVLTTGEPFVSEATLVTLRIWGSEPVDRYYVYNLAPLRRLDDSVYGLMAIGVDVTHQVLARNEIERLNLDLQKSARAKDEFLAMLGHELRNPLAPIVTALQLMRMKDTRTSKEQEVIGPQVDHLVRLVDDLLDVARITQGKVELRDETAPLRDVITRAVEMVRPLFEQKAQQLVTDIDDMRWRGDTARLAQIVSNLLSNSARYSPLSSDIHLSAKTDNELLRIVVTDAGQGIPADKLPYIFDLFVQGERQVDRAKGGLGIGLALVKNLVQMHGGSVHGESDGINAGSTFTVTLPIRPIEDVRVHVRNTVLAAASVHHRLEILVVDDNSDAADSLAEYLTALGHTTLVCYNPHSAIAMARDHCPDLAILDIGLPGMSGYELARELQGLPCGRGMRLIALSGYGLAEDRLQSERAGFHSHLVKPVKIDELQKVLKVIGG
ncbi:MAG: response regulator [Herminiimonas sp.]|nr:response regulator [Herminiimonas sp.]